MATTPPPPPTSYGIKLLDMWHTFLYYNTLGFVDMDKIQVWVHANTPAYSDERALKVVAASAFMWFIVFLICKNGTHAYMVANRKKYTWVEPYFAMTPQQVKTYISYIHAIVHAAFSVAGAVYGALYADGNPGTTWFNDHKYANTLWDIQKYLNLVSIGYLIYDGIFCMVVFDTDALMMQTYMHHVAGIMGNSFSILLDDGFGSIAQLTFITEFSTFFVNARFLLAQHKLSKTTIYLVNGIFMTLSFFVVRIVYYTYILFFVYRDMGLYDSERMKNYPENRVMMRQTCVILYFVMYGLQLFWFYKIFSGLMKVLMGGSKKAKTEEQKKTE